MRLADASLDKRAENVKIKAEDSGKSSYDQVIDELAEALKSQKGYTALSFWDKLSDRVSTANGSDKQSQNTVFNKDSAGTSSQRENNGNIIASLKEIYDVAYGYYKGVFSTKQRINLANLLTLYLYLYSNHDCLFFEIKEHKCHLII